MTKIVVYSLALSCLRKNVYTFIEKFIPFLGPVSKVFGVRGFYFAPLLYQLPQIITQCFAIVYTLDSTTVLANFPETVVSGLYQLLIQRHLHNTVGTSSSTERSDTQLQKRNQNSYIHWFTEETFTDFYLKTPEPTSCYTLLVIHVHFKVSYNTRKSETLDNKILMHFYLISIFQCCNTCAWKFKCFRNKLMSKSFETIIKKIVYNC